MWVQSIEFRDFRNYEKQKIEFDPGINLIYGDNAQGKTNILEGIFLCSTTRSHRRSSDKEMIRFGESEYHIKSYIYKMKDPHRIDIHYRKDQKKGIAIDGIPIRKAAEIYGYLNVVMFAPDDMGIVKNGPAERRRFLDHEICQTDPIYLEDLGNYNKTLEQRNKLLKEIQYTPSLEDTLDVWDEQLVKFGVRIIRKRQEYLKDLEKICRNLHGRLSSGKEKISLGYEKNAGEEEFEKKLEKSRGRDLFTMTTNCGPHRDDFSIKINGIDMRTFGSQGQQRSAAISLKLSEIHLIEEKTGELPVLLLDDVFSELDQKRQESLLEEIKGIQTIITGTGDLKPDRLEIGKRIYVKEGTALEEA